MLGAGDLFERVAFDAPHKIDDGYGGKMDGWASDDAATKVHAHFRYLRGGETVQAARLSGRQPVVVTIRNSVHARLIDATWRMRDLSTGVQYNIRSGPIRSSDRQFLEFTVESGVAI